MKKGNHQFYLKKYIDNFLFILSEKKKIIFIILKFIKIYNSVIKNI